MAYTTVPSYKSKAWLNLRANHLRANPLCKYCKDAGIVTPANYVDHIKPHRGDPKLWWDVYNLQSLCATHHNASKQREEKQGRPIGCDRDGVPNDPEHPWNVSEH